MLRRLALACGLAWAAPGSLLAQELRGTVRHAEREDPAVGVIVEAIDLRSGARVANTLTDSRGYFILRVPAASPVTVRALRIGQRPTHFGEFTLAAGETRTESFRLSGATILLDRVSIVGRTVCGAMRDTGAVVATLLDEARKALRSTQLTSTAGRLSADWALNTQLTDLKGEPLTAVTSRSYQSGTDRPFVSLPPDSLARGGYLRIFDDEYTYYAPDADVLLSEQFVDGHCFQAEPWRRDDRDWIGMGFRPAQASRGIVGIQGTLWFDRRSAELRLLEYRYVNLPREVAGAPAGGEVEFLRLPSGAWLAHRWSIRMPRPTVIEEPVFRRGVLIEHRRISRLRSMEIAGGEVRQIRAGNQTLYAAAPSGEVQEIVRSAATIAAQCHAPLGPREGVMWGTLRDGDGEPVHGARLELQWSVNARWIADWQRSWETRRAIVTTENDGSWFACGIPRAEPIALTVFHGETVEKPRAVRLSADEDGAAIELTLAGRRHDAVLATVYGTVHDSLLTGGPWVGAEVRLLGGVQLAVADADGRFALDSVPPGEHELAAWNHELLLLGVPLPRARVQVSADGRVAPVALATPSPAALFRQICGRAPEAGEGILLGEVRDLTVARRAGIKVSARWARTLVRAGASERDERVVEDSTDANGRFTLCGVPTDGEASKSGDVAVYASGEFTVVAEGRGLRGGPLPVRLAGAAVRRRDLIVGAERDRSRVTGRVLDQLGRPIAGATVMIGGPEGHSARSDSTGRWTIDGVPTRSTQLAIRALRYSPLERELDPVGGRLNGGDVRLDNAPQLLDAVTVRGAVGSLGYKEAFEDRRRSYAFGTFIDEEMLARQPVVTPQFIIRHISKARHAWVGSASNPILAGKSKIAFEVDRNFGAMSLCYPRWFIDGVDFRIPPAEEEELWLRQAKRVEVYKAGLAPAQYNDFDGCGVILIWTR